MSRGRTRRGRARAEGRLAAADPTTHPLLRTVDRGRPAVVQPDDVGASGSRWVDPFLEANRPVFRRLDLRPEVEAGSQVRLRLHPGARIGAVPLFAPATRKVAAGLLVEPRFRWAALGSVLGSIGFDVEPSLGGLPLVPGSAREVPAWLLAGPVLNRIAAYLRHERRRFVERTEVRTRPRGHVSWTRYASQQLPRGRWTRFPCTFSEPDTDPDLVASARWTLRRLEEALASVATDPTGRLLLDRTIELRAELGPGDTRRPSPDRQPQLSTAYVSDALQAMIWIAEERGLGGARGLAGLAWDLPIDEVWEAWVSAFAQDLSRRTGLVASRYGAPRRTLRWSGPVRSMGSLAPDVELKGEDRVVWIDAKYKAHLTLLGKKGWTGISDDLKAAHRADLHQALAYASLVDASRVDTVLAYPHLGSNRPAGTVAHVTTGRRRVRLILAPLPFGFEGPDGREATLREWRELLSAA